MSACISIDNGARLRIKRWRSGQLESNYDGAGPGIRRSVPCPVTTPLLGQSLMVNIVESTDERFLSTEGKQISQPQVFETGYYSSVLLSW